MEYKEIKSQKARDAANIRWNKDNNADALPTHSRSNASKVKEVKEKKESKRNNIKPFEERMTDFELELKLYNGEYPQEMLEAFYDYWSEPNSTKTKMKKELQKTWDTGRRLKTWRRNQKDFNKSNGHANIPESGGKDELMTFYKSQTITEDFDTWWQKYYTYNSGTARYSKKTFIKN